mgnify:FL=1
MLLWCLLVEVVLMRSIFRMRVIWILLVRRKRLLRFVLLQLYFLILVFYRGNTLPVGMMVSERRSVIYSIMGLFLKMKK